MEQQQRDWAPTESWIVLDRDSTSNRSSVNLGRDKKVEDSHLSHLHPDSHWFEECGNSSEDEMQSEVQLTPMIGMDSMAQAERRLGLGLSSGMIEGVSESEYLMKRSSNHQIIHENCRESPHSFPSLEEASQASDDIGIGEFMPDINMFSAASSLRYGGRAPPVLGGVAPPAAGSGPGMDLRFRQSDMDCFHPLSHVASSFSLPQGMSSQSVNKFMSSSIPSPRKDRLNKLEKRRSKKRRIQQKYSKWSYYIYGLGSIDLKSVVPLVVSHMFTLLVGIYIGRQCRYSLQSKTSATTVSSNSATFPTGAL